MKFKDKKNFLNDLSASNKSFKDYFKTIREEFKAQSAEEKKVNLQALILTIIIVAILIFIFWKVPFLHNLIF